MSGHHPFSVLRKRLYKGRREVLEEDVRILRRRLDEPEDVEHTHGDELDLALKHENQEISAMRRQILGADLKRKQEAIKRMDDGGYGVCVDCAEAIAAERLKALPEAERCIGCQRAHEQSVASS